MMLASLHGALETARALQRKNGGELFMFHALGFISFAEERPPLVMAHFHLREDGSFAFHYPSDFIRPHHPITRVCANEEEAHP